MAITVKIISEFDNKGVGQAEGSMQRLSKMAKLAGAAVAAAGAALAVGLAKAAQAAAEDQKSFAQLENTMRNVAKASDALVAATDKQIGRMSMQFGIADDKLRPAFNNLLRATGSVTLSQNALTAAMDLSVATGKDMDAVSLALGKALNGQTTALFKMLPGLRGVVDEGSSAADILAAINSQVGGAAEANTKTFAGALERLKIIFGEMVETVGSWLLPVLVKVADFLNNTLSGYFTYLSDVVGPKVENLFNRLGNVFRENILPVLQDYLIPAFQYLADVYQTRILPIVEKLAAVFINRLGEAFTMIRRKLDENRDSLGKLREFMDKVAVFIERYLGPALVKFYDHYLRFMIAALGRGIDMLVKFGEVAGPVVATVGKAIAGIAKGITNGINVAIDGINTFIGIYNRLPGFLKPFGNVGLLPNISLPEFDFTDYAKGGFGYLGDFRGNMAAATGPGGMDLGAIVTGTPAGGSSGGARTTAGPADPLAGMTPEQIAAGRANADFFAAGLDNPVVRRGDITVNVQGGLATSADIGRAVVDAIKQFTNVSGPADIAVA